jgi:hypothetical protein
MVFLATSAADDATSAYVLNADATALLPLRPRPGVFRIRDIREERADLCVQGEGERRLLSLDNYCRATLRTPLLPLAEWEIVRSDNVAASPSDSSEAFSRGAAFRVIAGGRFDLRLRSSPSYIALDSIARFEIEFTGPLEEDSVRVRIGWVDADTNVFWSDGAAIANRVPATPLRPYGRFEVNVHELLRNTGMDGAAVGRISLLLHVRGSVGASNDDFRLFLTAVSASGGSASPRP